jgi:hypothetical protein
MGTLGRGNPARDSSQPASSVSAREPAAAKRPAWRSTAKPSAVSRPAPPRVSGTQASVSPASSSAAQAGAPSSVARLVDGLRIGEIAQMRRVVSAIETFALHGSARLVV